jgi:hypothetical protein
LVIDLAEYLERRRRTASARFVQLATVNGQRVARRGAASLRPRSVRWANVLPLLPALELAALYAEASLI